MFIFTLYSLSPNITSLYHILHSIIYIITKHSILRDTVRNKKVRNKHHT